MSGRRESCEAPGQTHFQMESPLDGGADLIRCSINLQGLILTLLSVGFSGALLAWSLLVLSRELCGVTC